MSQARQPPAPDDEGWIVLTEGMESYERFRYVALKILEKGLQEAEPYAVDERLFPELAHADETAVLEHLESLDDKLQDDENISDLERAFLCASVGRLLEDRGDEACCYAELLALARGSEDER